MDRERKSIQVGVMDIMRAITISLTLASVLLVGLLSPSVAQPTAILGRKEDVMVWVLAFEISLSLIIGFVVLRSVSASVVGRRKIRSDAATVTVDLIDSGGCEPPIRRRIMRATTIPLVLTSLFFVELLSPSLAQPAQPTPAAPAQPAPVQPTPKRGGPCAQIAAACKQAGFVPQGAKSGAGIVVDCIRPIMVGTPQGVQGAKPLSQIDPQLVAASKQQNPNFGTARRANPQPSGQSATKPPGM
jgi:hypothetical protein